MYVCRGAVGWSFSLVPKDSPPRIPLFCPLLKNRNPYPQQSPLCSPSRTKVFLLKYNALQPCFGPWLGNERISVDCLYHLASLLRGREKPRTDITGHAVENMFWEDGKVKVEAQRGLVAYCEVTGLCRVE